MSELDDARELAKELEAESASSENYEDLLERFTDEYLQGYEAETDLETRQDFLRDLWSAEAEFNARAQDAAYREGTGVDLE